MVVYAFGTFALASLAIVVVLSALKEIDGSALVGPLAELILMVAVLYWTTTLLPGPVRKLGKAAGKRVFKSISSRKGK